jgi:ribosomal-protein-serine acetyltransferase
VSLPQATPESLVLTRVDKNTMNEQWPIPSAAVQLTDRTILLRAYFQDDVANLHAAVVESLPELKPYLDFARDDYAMEQSERWITGCPENWLGGTAYDFAITDAQTGAFLGGCGLSRFDTGHRTANLGYWVRTSKSGRGIATAAARLLARFGIEDLELKRIAVAAAAPNIASQRVAEKAGATREGVHRNGMFVRDLMYDEVVYSFVPGDFAP